MIGGLGLHKTQKSLKSERAQYTDIFVAAADEDGDDVDYDDGEDDDEVDYDDEDGGKNKLPSLFGPRDLSTPQEGQYKGEQHATLYFSYV